MTKELLKQALEALLSVKNHGWDEDTHTGRALITDLKAALEQPVQEPLSDEQIQKIWDAAAGAIPGWSRHIVYARAVIEALREALAQPVQEQQQAQLDVIAVNLMREGINKHRARELADHFVNFMNKPTTPPQENT